MKDLQKNLIIALTLMLAASVGYNVYLYKNRNAHAQNQGVSNIQSFGEGGGFKIGRYDSENKLIIDPLNYNQAITMSSQYRSLPPNRKLKNHDGTILNGFSFNKGRINELISNPEISDIYIMIGVHPDDTLSQTKRLTFALLGIKQDSSCPNGAISLDAGVYDFMNPCPDKCPKFHPTTEQASNTCGSMQ